MTDIKIMCAYDKMVDVVELVPNPKNPNKHRIVKIGLLRCKGKSSHVSHFLTCLKALMTRSHTCEMKAKIV